MNFISTQKIVFSTDSIHRGGKERQLFILTRALIDKGVKISILTRHFSKENYLSEYGLKSSILKIYDGRTWIGRFRSFKNTISAQNVDILISWDFQTSLFALLLYRKYKFIFVNASIQHGIRLLRISHLLRTLICNFSPFVIANSLAGLKANNLRVGKRRFVLNNGIENKFKNKLSKVACEELRGQIIPGYIERPGIVYITVANLVPYKDYFTVLTALNKMKALRSFYYMIIGDGPMRQEILSRIIEYGLEKRVILIGEIEDVNIYLSISDLMIHSSRGEGISNAILEGMYSGLPIIATNVGGVPETVFEDSSMLFSYKDEKALEDCLLRAEVVFAGFDKDSKEYRAYLEKFSVESMVTRFIDIIQTITE